VEGRSRESRRALQTGEAALDEVQDSLDRMADLARKSAEGGGTDRAALQKELEQLRESIERVISQATAGGVSLFQDGEAGAAKWVESLLYTSGEAGKEEGAQALPDWLMKGIVQKNMTAEEILAALGLDKTASGSDILAAITGRPLESGSVESYLATLYLGAVIAGGDTALEGGIDLRTAMEGLLKLLEKVEEGVPPDRAVELLTGGKFASLADFQARFMDGSAPGLETFLMNLLLSGEGSGSGAGLTAGSSLLAILAEIKGMNLETLMDLLSVSPLPEVAPEPGSTQTPAEPVPTQAQPMGNVQVSGQDLSGVSLRAPSGELVVGGGADVTVQGTGQGEQAVLLTGSGRTALQNVSLSTLTVDSSAARIFVPEQSILKEVRLGEGAVLTVSGGALAKIGSLHAGGSSLLRLTEGAAVALGRTEGAPEGESRAVLTVPVVVDGPVSLAAQAAHVLDGAGNRLEPFDLIWKTLLPGWSAITALEMDGRQAKMNLLNGDPVRLWLVRGDHGAPIHSLVVQGKDESGQPRTRYAYLHWNQNTQAFEEISMYPNPFSVTGGEPGRDWVYEEESQTLHILSSQVSAISGGPGTDAAQAPFSGRIVLADGIGPMELSLGGVVCRVSSGRAFSLGQGNEVTLILQSGTSNLFESGTGCAGISLGSGTSLNIDCADPHSGGDPDGVLTATGGAGGAGIGWDGEGGWDQAGQILIRGGVSVGAGGFMGSVTIIGGIIVSSDGRGGGEGGLSLQMGEDTVALPQFRLSSRILQLEGLSVATREQALAAQTALEADRRWVSRIQAAYGALYNQLDQSFGGLYSHYISLAEGMVRDNAAADTLLEDMRQSILLQPSQALHTHGRRGTEDVRQLLR
jgi:flagellin-like hook-associated protein FlgL